MTGRSSLPQRVVRFYSSTDFALDTIGHRQITFVHVSRLNDPFDPYLFFETDFAADYDRLLAYVRTRNPNDVDRFARHVPRENWGQSIQGIKEHFERTRNTSFVLSCSAELKDTHPRQNLYMWGHYGAGHRGVAIEFDTAKAASLLIDQHNRQKQASLRPEDAWIKIEYATDMPAITAKMFFEFYRNEYEGQGAKTSFESYYDRQTRVKSLVWKQEHEWRMLWRNDETHLKIHRAPIPDDAITAVYIGLAASQTVEADVAFETKRNFPSATVWKAFKKVGFSDLNFLSIAA